VHQVAVQSRISDYVAGWEHAVVGHDRGTSAGCVAKVPASRQDGKDNMLQCRSDESQGALRRCPQNCTAPLKGSRWAELRRDLDLSVFAARVQVHVSSQNHRR
jgi:hypothetical protein